MGNSLSLAYHGDYTPHPNITNYVSASLSSAAAIPTFLSLHSTFSVQASPSSSRPPPEITTTLSTNEIPSIKITECKSNCHDEGYNLKRRSDSEINTEDRKNDTGSTSLEEEHQVSAESDSRLESAQAQNSSPSLDDLLERPDKVRATHAIPRKLELRKEELFDKLYTATPGKNQGDPVSLTARVPAQHQEIYPSPSLEHESKIQPQFSEYIKAGNQDVEEITTILSKSEPITLSDTDSVEVALPVLESQVSAVRPVHEALRPQESKAKNHVPEKRPVINPPRPKGKPTVVYVKLKKIQLFGRPHHYPHPEELMA